MARQKAAHQKVARVRDFFEIFKRKRLFQETFFLERAHSGSAKIGTNFLAVDDNSLFLDVWLEDLAGLALREGNVVAIHLAFTSKFANCHLISPSRC